MSVPIKVGDHVVLAVIPSPVEEDRAKFPSTYELFSAAVGNRFTVRGFNGLNMAELWVTADGLDSTNACDDSIYVEIEYLDRQ